MSRRPLAGLAPVLAVASVLASARPAGAAATFMLEVTDEAGIGFNDMTAATPVGGNMGTTVGEQRRLAFQHALDIWGAALDSPIPIIVTASFGPLECTPTNVVLGQAGPAAMEYDVPGQDPNVLFPEALADRIAGVDIMPGFPDIQAEFNGSLSDCFAGMDWYYGFDAKSVPNTADLIMTVLHEVGHGLGFSSATDETTGEFINPGLWDPFTANLVDLATGMHWETMTDAGRLTSMGTPRGLVWGGEYGNAVAKTWLKAGAPRIRTTPEVPGLRDALIDANFGRPLTMGPVMGEVALPTPADQCAEVTGVTGKIAILPEIDCHPLDQLYFVETAGAIGGIVVTAREPPPALDQSAENLAIGTTILPVVGMMKKDADLLLAAPGVQVEIYANMTQPTGTDPMGRVYVFANNPVTTSAASHIDPAVRPDAVLEPSQTENIHHDVTLERAMLRDIGWATTCGNGMLDAGEQCDSGMANSDTMPNTCRLSCVNPKCGDGVVDTGEQCEPSVMGTPCNMNCTMPVCGDGVVAMGEECDNGAANSNTTADACRTTCKRASCGDGVKDSSEQCDNPATPDTCRACMTVVGSAGAGGGAGVGAGGSAGGGSAGAPATGGAGPTGAGGTGGEADPGKKDPGCGCEVPGSGGGRSSPWALTLGALALAAVGARRARRLR